MKDGEGEREERGEKSFPSQQPTTAVLEPSILSGVSTAIRPSTHRLSVSSLSLSLPLPLSLPFLPLCLCLSLFLFPSSLSVSVSLSLYLSLSLPFLPLCLCLSPSLSVSVPREPTVPSSSSQTTPDLIILPSHVTSLIDPTLNVFLLSSPGHFVSPTAAHHARTVSTNDSAIIW